jgi:acyl dehydratase/putative sterol carrier protein
MADLMRYATSFDMTKGAKEIAGRLTAAAAPAAAPAAAAPVAAAAAAPSASSVTDEVFSRMAEAFLPEKGAGWTANLLFDIKGIGEYSVEIAGGSVKTAKGKVGTPTCVINFATGDTFIDIVMGKEKAEKAFMAGKIKASNMADLMRYATSFDMTKGAKEIAARIAAPAAVPAAAPAAAPVAPRSPVGLRYREPAEFARAADIEAYAKATRDSNPRYAEGADQIAPPLFAVRAVHKMAQGAVMDRSLDLDLGRLVHGEQEMTFNQVLRPWDLMTPRGQLLKVEEKASGKVIDLGQTIFVDGAPAVEIVSRYFIRGSKSGGSSEPVGEPERGTPIFTSTATLEPGQTVDYAAASRDDNPIHTDESIAMAVGFPSVIGHGLLTMAFVQRGVIDNLLAGESANLKRLKVRFSKPVLPGDEITTRGWLKSEANGRRIIEIESVNQRGEKVITNGEAELA